MHQVLLTGVFMARFLFPFPEMQIEASAEKHRELEEQVRCQEMSATNARELHKSVKDAQDDLDRKRKQYHDTTARISELQIQHNK